MRGVILVLSRWFSASVSLSPARGSYSYDAIEYGKVLQFVPVWGVIPEQMFYNIRNKSLSPARGSYSTSKEKTIHNQRVCPLCGGVILSKWQKWLSMTSLSHVRGSYSVRTRLRSSQSKFVPRTGELFWAVKKENCWIRSLSPARGVILCGELNIHFMIEFVPRERELFYPVGMQIYRRSVCPPHESTIL